MKLRRAALPLLLALALLTSCAGNGIPLQTEVTTTLPPAQNNFVAPIGDAALEYVAPTTLYLPRHDGARLTTVTTDVTYSAARPHAESVVRALLGYAGDGVASGVGGDTKLSLYGANPVEISNGVATVNLAASALQLDRKEYYVACQCIANTLTELDDVQSVNVQVMDKQIGLDIASTLPTGAFSRSFGDDAGAVYEQTLTQRAASDEDATEKRLTAAVTLYFPMTIDDGVMPETRSISFTGQLPSDMIAGILAEMALGAQAVEHSPALPLLADLLTEAPAVTEPSDGSGQIVTLRFAYNFDDMLEAFGYTRASCMAALCYTLCTFLPNVAGVTVHVGDERVDELALADGTTLTLKDGVQRRADFAASLLANCTLYLARGGKLAQVRRPVYYYQAANPRALLLELAKGPRDGDSVTDAEPVMPVNALRDADMLGLSLSGGTLLVNFAKTFENLGEGFTGAQDRLLAYALVNTLACNDRVKAVRFFVTGEPPKGFTDEIYWAGDFYRNLGLAENAEP